MQVRSAKKTIPVSRARSYLEAGPVVLVSSAWKGESDVMTMGWHMVMGDEPPLVGAFIWDQNRSFELIRRSRECVINVPAVDLAETVVRVGNRSGREVDKFAELGLTARPGAEVGAPLIEECHASFECRLVDASLVRRRNLFVFEVVKAHARPSPKFPTTIHYRGEGMFMVAGPTTRRYRKLFRPDML